MTKLPPLYKKTKTGATQVSYISYKDNFFYVEFGQLDGKLQTNPTECFPTNVGRSNERTASQQAEFEALAYHKKKLKSGYSETVQQTPTVQLPQKVKTLQDYIDSLTYPCTSTPKLNGVNGTYWLLPDNTLKLTSRGGEEFPPIPHLEPEIRAIMQILDTTCLNGELYIHGEYLQDIQSAVKKPKELSKQLHFAIFELPLLGGAYLERKATLLNAELLWEQQHPEDTHIIFLTGVECHDFNDVQSHFNQCEAAKLEGTVVYLHNAPYEFNTRSSYVFKYKKPLDGEYQITDYKLDKKGHPTLICNSPGGTFSVRPKGTVAQREEMLQNIDSYINSWYKIEYETLSKAGKPQKPVGIGLRDCDSQGNPLE